MKNYRAVSGPEERADQGYIYSTLNDLDAIAEQNSSSINVPVKMVDIAMEHGYYDYASCIISTYLEEGDYGFRIQQDESLYDSA